MTFSLMFAIFLHFCFFCLIFPFSAVIFLCFCSVSLDFKRRFQIVIPCHSLRFPTSGRSTSSAAAARAAPPRPILLEKGFRVTGSDLLDNAAAATLRKHGATVAPAGHRFENLPQDNDGLLVVRTSAAGSENPEVAEAMRRGLPVLRRGEALAVVADSYKRPVAVSGSHGKTSVSAMLAWLLRELGANPGYMIGGAVTGWESAGAAGDGDLFVTEADESDGTHALLRPHLGIVTNVEDDHAWSLGGFEALEHNFKAFAEQSETLLYCASEETDRLFQGHPHAVRLDLADMTDGFLPGFGHFQRLDGMIAVKAAELLGFDAAEAEKTPAVPGSNAASPFGSTARPRSLRTTRTIRPNSAKASVLCANSTPDAASS